MLYSVHPRACGEHNSSPSFRSRPIGSSPRVRGTLSHGLPSDSGLRFIPARAGNTCLLRGVSHQVPVHPRACGEHVVRRVWRAIGVGSSPRVRGTRHFGVSNMHSYRFIPARAGNTVFLIIRLFNHAVHPRACGEHKFGVEIIELAIGSSPRVRGTHSLGNKTRAGRRFIPARAGNTRIRFLPGSWFAVHPRACGEHVSFIAATANTGGSSPRVRGTQPRCKGLFVFRRFIPARAGNTLAPIWTEGVFDGSSPRVRGTLHRREI